MKPYDYRLLTPLEAREIPDGATVVGSSFDQETPDTEIFRPDMKGVTFINCNLDNVKLPAGNTLVDCRQRRFQVQTDGHDWELDADNKPVRLVNWKPLRKRGIAHPNPKDLPKERERGAVDYLKQK